MIPEKIKNQIDSMTYEEMLSKWRFAPIGDPMFQGETGDYYKKVMKKKKDQLLDGEHVSISKKIGWEK